MFRKKDTAMSECSVDMLQRIMPHPYLRNFEVHLTEHCNLRCFACNHYAPLAEEKYIDMHDFEKDFARMSFLTKGLVDYILLLGGEPLLHPQVIDFLPVARKYFPKTEINIFTNALKITEMPGSFWKSCSANNIQVIITKYPIRLPWDKILGIFEKYHVSFKLSDDGENKKSWKEPLDVHGKQNAKRNFLQCRQANSCIFLKQGKLFTCGTPPNVVHFNRYFNQNVPVSEYDSIDIHKEDNIQTILRFLASPIPFCRYCNIEGRRYDLDWRVSRKTIEEWI